MRRNVKITIPGPQSDKNRDGGKAFLLTEMSAIRAEKWAARALVALLNSGLQLTDDEAAAGMAGLAAVASRASFKFLGGGLSYAEFEPLLDEMMGCVQIVEQQITRVLTEDDVEEVATLLTLKGEVLKLHTGFSLAERISAFAARQKSGA